MTDKEAADRIQELARSLDTEAAHWECDKVLMNLVRQSGYELAAEAFDEVSMSFWYA